MWWVKIITVFLLQEAYFVLFTNICSKCSGLDGLPSGTVVQWLTKYSLLPIRCKTPVNQNQNSLRWVQRFKLLVKWIVCQSRPDVLVGWGYIWNETGPGPSGVVQKSGSELHPQLGRPRRLPHGQDLRWGWTVQPLQPAREILRLAGAVFSPEVRWFDLPNMDQGARSVDTMSFVIRPSSGVTISL